MCFLSSGLDARRRQAREERALATLDVSGKRAL
jgi:hypothetical protein